ncbi:unnamed protein product [Cuscuta campestris]|uniref:Uncharacterized protein n=1 Tax=Cuscuta campestris TaxID=132261 RepID=A0A484KPM4_9ASTE|nr:unnamed protein product [Cuscuta campestris]
MAPVLSQNYGIGSLMLGTTPSSEMNFFIQTPSFAASAAAMYSASYLLVTLKANETSSLVHIMTYMMEPIAEAYGTFIMSSFYSGVEGLWLLEKSRARFIILRTISSSVEFLLSDTPFNWGVPGGVSWDRIPCSFR